MLRGPTLNPPSAPLLIHCGVHPLPKFPVQSQLPLALKARRTYTHTTHTHPTSRKHHMHMHIYIYLYIFGLTVIKNKSELGQKLRQCQSHFQFMSIKNGRRLLEWETRWGVFYWAAFEESCLFGDAHLGPTISTYYETVGLIIVSQQMACSWRSVQGTISLCSLAWFLEFSVPGLPHPVHPSLL